MPKITLNYLAEMKAAKQYCGKTQGYGDQRIKKWRKVLLQWKQEHAHQKRYGPYTNAKADYFQVHRHHDLPAVTK